MKPFLPNLKLILTLCLFSGICQSQAQTPEHDINYYISKAPFKMPAVTAPQFSNRTFNIKDYGAIGDGQTLNTQAFEKAIAACNAAGGGTVLIPPGLWLTGAIELKSNVNLHAGRGALITYSWDHAQYTVAGGKTKILLSGNNLENVAVTGEGVFDGGGEAWRYLKKSKAAPALWEEMLHRGGVLSKDGNTLWPTNGITADLKEKSKGGDVDYISAHDNLRPALVSITNSKNVLFDGPTFKNSPQFALNPKNCTNMIIRDVTIFNEYWAQNGDGIDLSNCKNSIVFNCTVHAGDDGICMKSSGGQKDGQAALQNIVIADCVVYHAHGGFVIGSNTDGGMQNIFVTNCNYVNTDVGIRVKSARGRGGLVHDVYIDSVYMHDILNEAILFNTYYDDAGPGGDSGKTFAVNDKTPRFEDFHISNVFCNGAKAAISITGLPEMPISKLYFNNVMISADSPVSMTEASDINLHNVNIVSPQPVLFKLNNAWNIDLNAIQFTDNVHSFMSLSGAKTAHIKVSSTSKKGLEPLVIENGGAGASVYEWK